jgi:hypothetical protein
MVCRSAALVWESVDGSKAQPAGQPNPVEGSLEFGLLVFDPDTIIAFGNPTNDLMPVRLFPGLRLRCMQRSAGSGRGRIRPVCESAQQGMVQEMEARCIA